MSRLKRRGRRRGREKKGIVGKREGLKELLTFSSASFLNDVGADMLRPFWPVFVTAVLGAPMSFLGLLDGLGEAIAYAVRFPSGYFSDRLRKRKPFIWLGYLFAACARVGYGLSKWFYLLLPFKVLDRAGKMRDPPRDALLSEVVEKSKRGSGFGFLTAADNLGATIGPLIAFLIFPLVGIRKLFFLAAVPSFVSALLIFSLIREKKRHRKKILFRFGLKGLDKRLKLLIFSSAIFALGWFSLSFFVVFVTKQVKIGFVPLLFIVMSGFASLAAYPAGRISDRIGRKAVLFVGYLLFSLVCFLFATNEINLFSAFVLFALYGVHYGIITSVQSPFVADLSRKELRGSALGVFQTVFGLCSLPASLMAGFLWDVFSASVSFYYGMAVSMVGALLFLFLVRPG